MGDLLGVVGVRPGLIGIGGGAREVCNGYHICGVCSKIIPRHGQTLVG